jgi:hypothetical protein
MEVHKEMGPRFLEAVYHECLENNAVERIRNFLSEKEDFFDYPISNKELRMQKD